MATYEQLESLVQKLKRSSIDAFMHESRRWEVQEDRYQMTFLESGTYSSYCYYVTRPAADGTGGGVMTTGDANPDAKSTLESGLATVFVAKFDQIRAEIEAQVAPWRNLPDPDKIALEVEKCRQVTRALSGAASVSGGKASGGGLLAGYLGVLQQNAGQMTGTTIEQFKLKFLSQLPKAIGGSHAISIVHGVAMASQEGMWRDTRQAVADALEQGQKTMEGIAMADLGAGFDLTLKIASWSLKAIGLFATGGVSTALEVGGLGIEILQGTLGEDPRYDKPNIPTYDQAMEAFRGAIVNIEQGVRACEGTVRSNLLTNLANIRADKGSYDLTDTPIAEDPGMFVLHREFLTAMWKEDMPTISNELKTIATAVDHCVMRQYVRRDASIGIGADGPSDAFDELSWMLYEVLGNQAWDVDEGAANLHAVQDDFYGRDSETLANLSKVIVEILLGTPVDPWAGAYRRK